MLARVTVAMILVALAAAPMLAADRAVCAVCGPREGSGLEEVKATATYKGRQYFFCSLACKIEFLKNPDAFLVTESGKPAPDFSLTTFDGKQMSFADLRGKVVLLDFWATFCAPCIAALPELQALHAKHAASGLAVIGVTIDDRPALVKKATTAAAVGYPILKATPAVLSAYKVTALPALVLIGRDGTIIRRFGGEADKTLMLSEIERAIAAQPTAAGR